MVNRVKFRFGEIEFEAEGTADVIERERNVFMDRILPSAIEAAIKTKGKNYIGEIEESSRALIEQDEVATQINIHEDLSRTSLPAFLKKYGNCSDQDFVLFAVYYDEMKNGNKVFNVEIIKNYYAEARRSEYSNYSVLVNELVKKGYIMEKSSPETKGGKQYTLTSDGISYIENYVPGEDKKKKPMRNKKNIRKTSIESKYASLNADDLKMNEYVDILSYDKFIDRMLLVMYILTREGKGLWFTKNDIEFIMLKILGLPVTLKQIDGVIKRKKVWFETQQDPDNSKAYTYRLLDGGKKYAESLLHNK